jgi:Ca-activated chloride channel family protein
MSFREPLVLLGLALVPLAVLAYLGVQRRRTREAAAFASPALMPNLVTAEPGLRRHLPALLLLAALAALVIAVARPERTVAAPQRQATVVMITDTSGSMKADDVEPDRMTAAVRAAHTLVDRLPENFRLGLVTFADYAEQQVAPTTERAPVEASLDRLIAVGGTAMGDAIRRGVDAARVPVPDANGTGSRRLPAVIVLLSDGKNTAGTSDPVEMARRAAALRIPINTIALGTPNGEVEQVGPFGFTQRVRVPPDRETLREIARLTRGRYFEALSSDQAEDIYANLGTRLSSRPIKREVTVAFAGGAVVLLLAGGALGLRWFGRLV